MQLRKLFVPAIAAALAVASQVSIVSAQEGRERPGRPEGGRPEGGRPEGGRPEGGRPEGGRFGGGPGGPGGPGGMMMMGMGGRGGAGNLIGLLAREEVRNEIEMMPDQVAGLRKLAERQRPERPDFDFRNASDEERAEFAAKMQAQQAERAADAKASLEELLLPKQFERLEQIALQAQGAAALMTPEVAEKLGLSKEVTAAMTKDMEASVEKGREMMQAAMRDRDREAAGGIREKISEMRKELETKLVAHLSDEQKSKFEELKGEPFELAPMTFGDRGPGGPGGFGGPGRERGGEGRESAGRDRERGGEGRESAGRDRARGREGRESAGRDRERGGEGQPRE